MKDFDPRGGVAGRRSLGLAAVLLLHVLVVWGMMTGLARKVIEAVRPTVTMAIVPSAPPAPPVPPAAPQAPPKVARETKVLDRPPPVRQPPPPSFVPAAEVQPLAAPEPAIQAVQEAPAAAPTEAPPAPTKVAVGLLCPGYEDILHRALEGAVEEVGVEGEVRVRITVQGHEIIDAQPIAGPRAYYRQVQSAVRRFHCTSMGTDQAQTAWLTAGFRQE